MKMTKIGCYICITCVMLAGALYAQETPDDCNNKLIICQNNAANALYLCSSDAQGVFAYCESEINPYCTEYEWDYCMMAAALNPVCTEDPDACAEPFQDCLIEMYNDCWDTVGDGMPTGL